MVAPSKFGNGWVISLRLYWACDYFSMLGLKLNHVSKKRPGSSAFLVIVELLKWCFIRAWQEVIWSTVKFTTLQDYTLNLFPLASIYKKCFWPRAIEPKLCYALLMVLSCPHNHIWLIGIYGHSIWWVPLVGPWSHGGVNMMPTMLDSWYVTLLIKMLVINGDMFTNCKGG